MRTLFLSSGLKPKAQKLPALPGKDPFKKTATIWTAGRRPCRRLLPKNQHTA